MMKILASYLSFFVLAIVLPLIVFGQGNSGKGGGGQSSCPAPPPPVSPDTKCYSEPGCLDTTFDFDGLVTTDLLANRVDLLHRILVQGDGKIVGVGQINNLDAGTATDFLVVRYNPDGSLDTSFGDIDPLNPIARRGFTSTAFTVNQDWASTAVLQSDGKIVVGGTANLMWAVARYNTDGTLDPSFNGNGILTIDVGMSAGVNDMAIQSDGKLVLVGEPNFTIARLNTDGSFDTAFGTGGKATVNPSNVRKGFGRGIGVAIQRIPAVTGEERPVVTGLAVGTGASTFATMRFRSTGAVDTSFGSNGQVLTSIFGFSDQANSIAVDPSNKIVVGGTVYSANTSCGSYVRDFGVARYTANGTLDTTFSGDGKVTTNFYGGLDVLYGIAVQPDDKIIAVGHASFDTTSTGNFAVVRYNVDGSPDPLFGLLSSGVVTTDISGDDWAYSVALQSDGKIVVGGGSLGGAEIGLARYLP